MSLAYAGGYANEVAQMSYPSLQPQTNWPDVAMRILNQYGLWSLVSVLLLVVIVLLIWKGRK